MTITHSSTLATLALAAIALQPLHAAAQGTRAALPAPSARQAATAPAPAPPPGRGATTPDADRPWNEQDYRLGAGDKLRIEVYGEPQLSQSLQIRPDGKITLPLAGDIVAAGRTSTELRDAVTVALKDLLKNPVVTVIVQEATAAQVHVVGEVASQGTQVLTGPRTVLQVLAQAGGLKEFAKQRDIRILRWSGTGQRTIEFDYKDAINGRIDPVYVEPGDTIVVP